MDVLRTPDARFAELPGFVAAPRYLETLRGFEGLRLHYVDEGPRDAVHAFLCLHGEPTWSYLYRRMLPVLTAAGARVVAPDFYGFGRSDKPVDDGWYTFTRHRDSLVAFIEALDLRRLVVVCQDWGGLLGLTLPHAMPERVAGLFVMNTALGTGDVPLTEGFREWRAYMARTPELDCAKLMARACPHLTPAESAAYGAPFPDARHLAGVRRFPQLVPEHADDDGAAVSREARDFLQHRWSGRTFMAIGMKDPVLGAPAMHALRKLIRGCPPPYEHASAGHFAQEWGETIARAGLPTFVGEPRPA